MKTIIGIIKCLRNETGWAYSRTIDLDFKVYPEHFAKTVDHWLSQEFDYDKLEGKKIKITAEIMGDNKTV